MLGKRSVGQAECRASAVGLWKAWQPGSAAKLVDASPPVSFFEILIRHPMLSMGGGWKLWWMACRSLVGAQLAIDTTMVCTLHSNGQPRRRAGVENGVALAVARQRKERTYPELVSPNARARLVVL